MTVKRHNAEAIKNALEIAPLLEDRISPEFVLASDYDELLKLKDELVKSMRGSISHFAGYLIQNSSQAEAVVQDFWRHIEKADTKLLAAIARAEAFNG
jgi:hypothetical protein